MKTAVLAVTASLAIAMTSTCVAGTYTVLRTDRLVAIPGESVPTSATVLIEANRIAEIREGQISDAALGEEGHEIAASYDLAGKTVFPGFIDGHVHITFENNSQQRLQAVQLSTSDFAMLGAHHARKTLMAGFTTIRDVGGDQEAVQALRTASANNYVPAPRIVTASVVGITGGHSDGSQGYIEEIAHMLDTERMCNGGDDCRRATRWLIARGADGIKITATGGVLSNTATGVGQQMMDDELTSVVEAARAYGRDVTAHAHGTAGVNAALLAGVRTIEHGTYADDASFRLFKRRDAFLVPTILAGETVTEIAASPNSFLTPPQAAKALEVGPQIKAMVREAHAAGVKIAFGTDSGVSRHGENAREFGLMVEAGMTPEEAIRSATVVGSENLRMENDIGTIEVGKFADIVAVDGDPYDDVTILEAAVSFVMKDGNVFKSPR
ncbi:MAG: amidohydrolase family protein [Pseudomonadota bacterium]